MSSTTEKLSVVQKEGSRNVNRVLEFYNLDAIISVGYRGNSVRTTQFRRWATKILKIYDEELSNIVDSGIIIEKNSKYEVEIRASQIFVLDYICKKLNNVFSMDVNDYLFVYSKKVKSIARPYHKCRNTNY